MTNRRRAEECCTAAQGILDSHGSPEIYSIPEFEKAGCSGRELLLRQMYAVW